MVLSRRELMTSGVALAFGLGPLRALAAATVTAGGGRLIAGAPGFVYSIDLKTLAAQTIKTEGVVPHSFLAHPRKADHLIVVEKSGATAVEIDLRAARESARIACPSGHLFYGHGCFDGAGDVLLISRFDTASGLGHLVGYDARDYRQVVDHQVVPGGLHDVQLLTDRKTLAVTSSGVRVLRAAPPGAIVGPILEKSALVYVEAASGKVLGKEPLPVTGQVIGHFAVAADGTVVAITIPLVGNLLNDTVDGRGEIYIARKGGRFARVELPAAIADRIHGEMLSVAIDEQQKLACVTNPTTSTVLFLDIARARYERMIELPVNGVGALATGGFVLSPRRAGARVHFVSPAGAVASRTSTGEALAIVSSHLLLA